MADYRYRVTTRGGQAELRDKGSRFLAWVEPVESERDVAARLRALASEHPTATHQCWAWRLGQPPRERAVDAGEPAGTAGTPMLQVLRGAEVSDTLAVVARWFGGTKLGKGGLARAYAGAVRAGLEQCLLGERYRYEALELEMPYDRFGAVQRLVHPPEVEIGAASYAEAVRCTLYVVPPRLQMVGEQLAALGIEVREPPEQG